MISENNILFNKLKAEFNSIYMDFITELYEYYFNEYDKSLEIYKKYNEIEGRFINKLKENYILSPQYQKWKHQHYIICENARNIVKQSKDEYILCKIEDFNNSYYTNIEQIANRILKKNLDINKIKIIKIDKDPKLINFIITDSKVTLYGRSIKAAQHSTKMTPHLRFIITEKEA